MMNLKKLTLSISVLVLGSAAQLATAHTVFQKTVDVPANGSGTVYNNIVIGHTCQLPNGKYIPVVAQSVVFPTLNPVITESVGSAAATSSSKTIADILQQATTTNGVTTVSARTTLANLPQLIQNNDLFSSQAEKVDASNNVIGFEGIKGKLATNLHGLVPFRTSDVRFNPTACVKSVKVKVAIADICRTTFKKGGPVEGAANLWIPNKTAKFSQTVDGIGSPGTLTFNNTATTVDATCKNGNNIDYTITPSDADIDANLPIKKYWGN